MQPDFLIALLKTCRESSIHTAVDTCGYAPREVMETIAPLTDLFMFDLKLMDDSTHAKRTGVSNRLIHDNLRWLAGQGAAILIRVPLIPGVSDSRENLEATAAFVDQVCPGATICLLPYNRLGQDKARRYGYEIAGTVYESLPADQIEQRVAWLEARGRTVKVGG